MFRSFFCYIFFSVYKSVFLEFASNIQISRAFCASRKHLEKVQSSWICLAWLHFQIYISANWHLKSRIFLGLLVDRWFQRRDTFLTSTFTGLDRKKIKFQNKCRVVEMQTRNIKNSRNCLKAKLRIQVTPEIEQKKPGVNGIFIHLNLI